MAMACRCETGFTLTDNCRALRAVLERGRPGETYHIGGGNPLPNIDVLRPAAEDPR